MSSFDLSEEYELRQMTCWTFKWKIQQAMKSSCSYSLEGEVDVDEHISKDANIITDEWNSYLPIKADYPNLEQRKSENGSNFPDMHIHIMNIKGWLRGIHHHCTKEQLQGYLDEYHV